MLIVSPLCRFRITAPTIAFAAFAYVACITTTLLLPAVLIAQATETQSDTAADKVDLPSGQEVIDKYLEALGGREALGKLKSSRMSGELSVAGMTADIHILRKRPDKFVVKVDLGENGKVHQGTDGKHAWNLSPQGARLLEGEEKAEMMKRADFDEELHLDKYYKTIECTGIEDDNLDGKKCYKVELTDPDGKKETRFFAVSTNLLVKVETKRTMLGQEFDVESWFDDYRDVGGLKTPFKTEVSAMMVNQIITFKEVEFDVELDESSFAPPEEVVELIEAEDDEDQ
jgi:hypothetical protein